MSGTYFRWRMHRTEKVFAVYIMSNCKRGVLYVGVTSNLHQSSHRSTATARSMGFTKRYQLKRLVWYRVV